MSEETRQAEQEKGLVVGVGCSGDSDYVYSSRFITAILIMIGVFSPTLSPC